MIRFVRSSRRLVINVDVVCHTVDPHPRPMFVKARNTVNRARSSGQCSPLEARMPFQRVGLPAIGFGYPARQAKTTLYIHGGILLPHPGHMFEPLDALIGSTSQVRSINRPWLNRRGHDALIFAA
jgi:hypothetical protein